jgi:hypothetical protein
MKNGLIYLSRFLENRYYLPLMCLVAFIRGFSFERIAILVSTIGYCAYAAWIGGDFFPGSRFFYVTLPFVCVLIQDFIAALLLLFSGKVLRTVLASGLGLLAGALVFTGSYGPSGEFRHFVLVWAQDDYKRIQFAKDLAWVTKSGQSILAGPIGQIGYYTGLRVLDYWGVIDPHIARLRSNQFEAGVPGHEKTDLQYLMQKKPTYIVFGFDYRDPPEGYSSWEFTVENRRWRVLKRNSP